MEQEKIIQKVEFLSREKRRSRSLCKNLMPSKIGPEYFRENSSDQSEVFHGDFVFWEFLAQKTNKTLIEDDQGSIFLVAKVSLTFRPHDFIETTANDLGRRTTVTEGGGAWDPVNISFGSRKGPSLTERGIYFGNGFKGS